ncbi:hypothetical protein BD779DRAFT_1431621 [Infundibulicybe gibba]|nr:hypothetical protein BD779DRAFT_1431621 [Infundibulicybe gibba]
MRARPHRYYSRRRYVLACASLVIISFSGLVSFFKWTGYESGPRVVPPGEQDIDTPQHDDFALNVTSPIVLDPTDPSFFVNGPPTAQFRDNLRPNVQYITSWISAGWTNDVITYANLIYLGLITDRVPIIPMFTPSHIGGSVPPIDFGQVFDMARLRKELGKPVLEWYDVKDRQSDSIDELGCWNTWEAVQDHEAFPRRSSLPEHLKLDISYTKAPSWIKLIPRFEHDRHSSFWSLASLAFPEMRTANLVTPLESPLHHVSLPPDEHLLCYDFLYFVCAHAPYEMEHDFSPVWRYVGQHMHWAPALEQLADQYVRRAIGVEGDTPTPPWITIHVRHRDFADWCGSVPLFECFATLPVISRRVQEVKAELLETKGIVANHVIMTSDDRNATWWDEVAKLGWYAIDHSQTAEIHGHWYPVLIDAVIQSNGIGFVGTDRSTMSLMARRRVQSWHSGVVRTVRWGNSDADNH